MLLLTSQPNTFKILSVNKQSRTRRKLNLKDQHGNPCSNPLTGTHHNNSNNNKLHLNRESEAVEDFQVREVEEVINKVEEASGVQVVLMESAQLDLDQLVVGVIDSTCRMVVDPSENHMVEEQDITRASVTWEPHLLEVDNLEVEKGDNNSLDQTMSNLHPRIIPNPNNPKQILGEIYNNTSPTTTWVRFHSRLPPWETRGRRSTWRQ